uniref:Uncharacterized protein n=1 Tax=Cucumis sativus TaxID=3659 RepID=A0A0A0KUW4_CUCSA
MIYTKTYKKPSTHPPHAPPSSAAPSAETPTTLLPATTPTTVSTTSRLSHISHDTTASQSPHSTPCTLSVYRSPLPDVVGSSLRTSPTPPCWQTSSRSPPRRCRDTLTKHGLRFSSRRIAKS